jgi:carbonic anhydrase/acetyltransferase-like protein (isoleucine patch superfamily)
MPAYQLDQFLPDIDPSCWIAPCATIIGNVVVGSGSSIWFGSVVRGDNEPIVIGERINIQDGCILHSPLRIGNNTTVGHRAVVYGCTIGAASVADRPRLDATTASRQLRHTKPHAALRQLLLRNPV